MAKRIVTLAVALLLLGVYAAPAIAEDYRDAEKNFKTVFANAESSSAQKADAIRRLGNAASDPRDAKKALKEFFNLLKDKNLLNDRQIQAYEAEREKIQAEHKQIADRARANGNRAPQSDIDRMSAIEARTTVLNDLINSNNVAKNAVVDAIARMTDAESKAEIIKGITDRDATVASACIDAARKGRWRDAWDPIVSAFDSKDAGVRVLAITALRTMDANRAMPVMVRAIDDEHYMVRSQAVIGMRAARTAQAVEALIGRLDKESPGRLKWDIVYALQDITGKGEYGADSVQWRGWWNANKGSFQAAPPSNPGGGDMGENGDNGGDPNLADGHRTGAFYGIPIRTKHPVFVVDNSGSMLVSANPNDPQVDAAGQPVMPPPGHDSRWQVCQKELIKAIQGLPEDGTFAIVHFSTSAEKYENGAVFEATDRNKKRAEQIINSWNAEGLTNIYEAFQFAFEICTGGKLDAVRPVITGRSETKLNADTIFFLTDGSPTVGQPINGVAPSNPPNQSYSPLLLEEICKWNDTRGIIIHTICIGEGDVNFLGELAKRNRGTFRKVVGGK
ncbi:MAG: HEAT repeat domain-containing protein [Planctomycetota bacterium]